MNPINLMGGASTESIIANQFNTPFKKHNPYESVLTELANVCNDVTKYLLPNANSIKDKQTRSLISNLQYSEPRIYLSDTYSNSALLTFTTKNGSACSWRLTLLSIYYKSVKRIELKRPITKGYGHFQYWVNGSTNYALFDLVLASHKDEVDFAIVCDKERFAEFIGLALSAWCEECSFITGARDSQTGDCEYYCTLKDTDDYSICEYFKRNVHEV
jgi:hypothetical protein